MKDNPTINDLAPTSNHASHYNHTNHTATTPTPTATTPDHRTVPKRKQEDTDAPNANNDVELQSSAKYRRTTLANGEIARRRDKRLELFELPSTARPPEARRAMPGAIRIQSIPLQRPDTNADTNVFSIA